METVVDRAAALANLSQFCGTEGYTRGPGPLLLTDGTVYLAEVGQCYWLMDIIASVQGGLQLSGESFQVWKLTVNLTDQSAVVVCTDGNDHEIYRQDVPYTDFPTAGVTLFAQTSLVPRGLVVMLPSEY